MMPLTFSFHDVNEAYTELQTVQHHYTDTEETRNGKARVFKAPVIIQHTHPNRRVLFDPVRDANPFFHYMEAIWMLAGDDNVNFPSAFASNIKKYSDDGYTLYGAYGHRWRHHFALDQIANVIDLLNADPATRRAVIAMWSPRTDLGHTGKDIPCNTHIYFRRNQGKLDMTVCNRSNDMVWGMLGSNIVHFSILQEYIAGALSWEVGNLFQFTNNLHIYDGWEDKFSLSANRWYQHNRGYSHWKFSPDTLDIHEAKLFVNFEVYDYRCRILARNAKPMLESWSHYKAKDFQAAVDSANKIYDEDWRYACIHWLKRREANV